MLVGQKMQGLVSQVIIFVCKSSGKPLKGFYSRVNIMNLCFKSFILAAVWKVNEGME